MFAAEILTLGKKENEIAAQFHGGVYTPIEFAATPRKWTKPYAFSLGRWP